MVCWKRDCLLCATAESFPRGITRQFPFLDLFQVRSKSRQCEQFDIALICFAPKNSVAPDMVQTFARRDVGKNRSVPHNDGLQIVADFLRPSQSSGNVIAP